VDADARRARQWLLAAAFLILLVLLCVAAGLRTTPEQVVVSDMMALLPSAEADPTVTRAVRSIRQRLERRQALLVSAPGAETARQAARSVVAQLRGSGLYAAVTLEVDVDRWRDTASFYAPYRGRLLAEPTRKQLAAGTHDALIGTVQRELYTPLSTLRSLQLSHDPFLVFERYLKGLGDTLPSKLALGDGVLTAFDGTWHHVFVQAELADSPFSLDQQQRVGEVMIAVRAMLAAEWPAARLASAGVIDHAVASSRSAKREISIVGVGSLIGIVVIQLITFGGIFPLVAILLAVALGIIAGFAACLLIFGEVHLLTLVAGSSLIGISVDYAFHFLADRFRQAPNWSADVALAHVLPGIRLGLITSLLGFAGLGGSGFPGLQQIAVFSAAGLCAAYGVVRFLYPVLFGHFHLPAKAPLLLRFASRWLELWSTASRGHASAAIAVAVPLLAVLLWGAMQLSTDDNLRLLHNPDPATQADAATVAEATGRNPSSQFFLVETADAEALLQAEEALHPRLEAARRAGAISGFQMLSLYVPSRRRQDENLALLQTLAAGDAAPIDRLVDGIGLDAAIAERFRRGLAEAENATLDLHQWLADPASAPARHLWLGATKGGVVAIVALDSVRDLAALAALETSDGVVRFVDHVAMMSDNFGRYRERASLLLALAYLVISLVLAIRYGIRGMLACISVPLGTVVVTLGLFGLAGVAVNLFHVVALTLVLGMGVDYVIFCREAKTGQVATMLAILLSALSTQLAFGLLAFSSVAAIHGFGLTVLIGMIVAYVLAPLSRYHMKPQVAFEGS
jgi:predicted exporter